MIYDHLSYLKRWDDEFTAVMRAWSRTPIVWRLVLSLFPREGWNHILFFFGWLMPNGRNKDFWFLEGMIFNSHTRGIRYGDAKWEDIQKYLKRCIFHERCA